MHHGLRLCRARVEYRSCAPQNLEYASIFRGYFVVAVPGYVAGAESQIGHTDVFFHAHGETVERAYASLVPGEMRIEFSSPGKGL